MFRKALHATLAENAIRLHGKRTCLLSAPFTSAAASPTPSSVLPVFPGLPKTISMNSLPKPQMRRSTLVGNGLRVASQETYGQLCNFGVFVDAGSRVEVPGLSGSRGCTHLMELMAFKSTTNRNAEDLHLQMAEMGATTFCYSARDLIMYNVEVLRESLPVAMQLLSETILSPRFDALEIDEMKGVMAMIAEQQAPDALLKEGLHSAAFGGESTALGQTHLLGSSSGGDNAKLLEGLTPTSLQEYRAAHFTSERLLLVGAGVDHDEFAALAETHFGDAATPSSSGSGGGGSGGFGSCAYVGGEHRNPDAVLSLKGEFTHVALSWMSSWEEPVDRVPICVMQVLLGGGNSFSAGGPGKGMYSRLYREVLNRYHDVETCEAHVEATGLCGIVGACQPRFAEKMVYVMAEQFAKLAFQPIADEELSRAKNMLKCNVLTCLESPHMVFEDIGQQLIVEDKYITPTEVCAMIDAVTSADLNRVAAKAVSLGPSLASVGEHTAQVPSIETVKSWFKQ